MEARLQRNNTIDLLRFLTCPFILLIHCPLPGLAGEALVQIGRYGVPFFLLLSGWFSYGADAEIMSSRARKKLIDTLKLLGAFCAAYFIMNSVSSLLAGKGTLSWIRTYANIPTLVFLVLCNRAVFFGSTAYYAFMLLYTYAVFMILIRFDLLNRSFFVIPILLAANVLMGYFTTLPWYFYGNFLFTGLPFFLLGHWLRKNHTKFPKNPSLWVGILLIGILLTLAEAHGIHDSYCYFGSILMAVSLLFFAVNNNIERISRSTVQVLQRYSVYIFVVHCGVRDMLRAFMERWHLSCSDYLRVFLILLISVLIGVIWDSIIFMYKKRLKHG